MSVLLWWMYIPILLKDYWFKNHKFFSETKTKQNKCFLTLFLLVEFSNMRLYAVVVVRVTGEKPKKKNSFAHVCTYLRIRIATYHNGCFCEILPENYFRPISILNTIVQQILQIKATIFSKKPLFFLVSTHWYLKLEFVSNTFWTSKK